MIEANFLSKGALGAYSKIQGLQPPQAGPELDEQQGVSFSDLVKDASQDAVETLRSADEATVKGLTGEMSIQEVVEATLNAEATLTTVVSIRDKFVDAYKEVLRMPV